MDRNPDCLFCKIIEKKIPARMVYEDSLSIAFEDINPQAPTHILIVPRKHIADIHSIKLLEGELVGHLFLVAQLLGEKLGLDKNGYRMVINNGRDAGQTIFHIHLHLLSGRVFTWPPG